MSPTICAFALVVSLLPTPALVQQSATGDRDLKELATYALTMDTVNKIDRAMQAVAGELKKDPKFAEQMNLASELDALKKTLVQAGLAAGLQKAGMLKELPAGTNPANVKFVLDHQADLQQMQQKWQALGNSDVR